MCVHYCLTLSLHPSAAAWLWDLEVMNSGTASRALDAILIQDIGLGGRGFLMNNEAYASQYIDHHAARHDVYGPVVMSRQNLAQQGGRNPWVAHGCLDGANGFATDGMQIFGPAFRDSDAFGLPLAQTCRAAYCNTNSLAPRFNQRKPFCLQARARHGDFSVFMSPITPRLRAMPISLGSMPWHGTRIEPAAITLASPVRSLAQNAPAFVAGALDAASLDRLYPERLHEEWVEGRLLSFFTPGTRPIDMSC